jgi:hypothetical protein
VPVNPTDQIKAMFTVQRGPNKTDNDMSVSLDASSIELPMPLEDIQEPEQKAASRARQTKIIALLGLDTIATSESFADFRNYFTVRSVESELCQEIIAEHLTDFDPSVNISDLIFFNLAAKDARAQRYAGNCLHKIHTIFKSANEGIVSTDGDSAFDRIARESFFGNKGVKTIQGEHLSNLPFMKKIAPKTGMPQNFDERIQKFLGLQGFQDQRPSLQYIKLAMDMHSMMAPRTCPTFFDANAERLVASDTSQALMSYRTTVTGWNNQGASTTSEGFRELNISHLQRPIRISPNRYDHALMGRGGQEPLRILSHLSSVPHHKKISALMYVVQRDHEVSYRTRTNQLLQEMRQRVGLPSVESFSLNDAFAHAKSASSEGHNNILLGVVGPPEQYSIEDRDSIVRTKWFRVCSLEASGLQQTNERGNSASSPNWISSAQLYQKVNGTISSVESLGNLAEGLSRRADAAKSTARNWGSVGDLSDKGITSPNHFIGKFLERLSAPIGRMFRTTERLCPAHFQKLANAGEDSPSGGSKHFDINRWKAYGLDSASFPYANRNSPLINQENEFIQRQWAKSSADKTMQALQGDMRSNIEYLRGKYRNDTIGRAYLDTIEEYWRSFSDKINETNTYNAASKGVLNLNTEDSPHHAKNFASVRASMGLALVLSSMKHRNVKDSGKYEFYNRLYSRFRYGIFSKLVGTPPNSAQTTADPALVWVKGVFGDTPLAQQITAANMPMKFRDAITNPEGGIDTFLRPLANIGSEISRANIHSIDEISRHVDDAQRIPGNEFNKAKFFGYIKTGPDNGNKFEIPAGQRVYDYGDNFGADNVTGQFLENGIGKVCNLVSGLGIMSSELSSEEDGKSFAINMARGQAEEYYEIGWSIIGDEVVEIMSEVIGALSIRGMLSNGLTKAGGQGLDTYITMFFEILGMVADVMPLSVCNSQDFFDNSPDKGEAILLEDVDLRNSISERTGRFGNEGPGGELAQNQSTLFFSKSGVDSQQFGAQGAHGIGFEMTDKITELYQRVTAAAKRWQHPNSGNENVRGAGYRGLDPDGNPVDSGTGRLHLRSRLAKEWLARAVNHAARDNQDRQVNPPTSDIALVIPKLLKGTIQDHASTRNFKDFSASAWLKQIGLFLRTGRIFGGSEYKENDEQHRHEIVANYVPVADTRMSYSIDTQDAYLEACDNYMDLISISSREGSILDIYRIAENLVYNDLARTTISTSLSSYNEIVIDKTSCVQSKVQKIIDDMSVHPSPLAINPSSIEKIVRNIDAFDPATSDRPLRTVAKLSPRNAATTPLTVIGVTANAPEDYQPDKLLQLGSYSEFTSTMKNLMIKYLEEYPIEDFREAIIAAGCPAGSDTKNLGAYQGQPFGVRSPRGPTLNPPRDPHSESFSRIFKITVERDLQTHDDENCQFTVERKYQMRYFLLPESFEGITPNDLFEVTDARGWLRAMSKKVKWFRAPEGAAIGEDFMDKLDQVSYRAITRRWGLRQELDDMVESFILQWLVAFVSGVMIDQDLLFETTDSVSSMDVVAPATTDVQIRGMFTSKESQPRNYSRPPILGFPINALESLLHDKPINGPGGLDSKNPNYLGINHFRVGLKTNAEAKELVIDDYRTELDPDTGAEIRIPEQAVIKPWNIRLTASMFNTYLYKSKIITSIMSSRPSFDYIMFCRIKKDDFAGTGLSPVDILSYRVSITNGRPQTPAETVNVATASRPGDGRLRTIPAGL